MENCVKKDYQFEYFSLLNNYFRLLLNRRDMLHKIAKQKRDEGSESEKAEEAEKAEKADPLDLPQLEVSIKEARDEIRSAVLNAERDGKTLGLENIARQHSLSEIEWGVLVILCMQDVPPLDSKLRQTIGAEILECLLGDSEWVIFHRSIFYRNSPLMREKLIEVGFGRPNSIMSANYRITEKTWRKILSDTVRYDKGEAGDEEFNEGDPHNTDRPELVELRQPDITLNDVALPEQILSELRCWLTAAKNAALLKFWGMEKLLGGHAGTLLMYGPPGTGKTMTAEAIAGELEMPLVIARYEQIMNMWYGNTSKNLVAAFDEARERHAVLLFDECDAMFSRRTQVVQYGDRHENRHVNILLHQLEIYEGIVILTSNFADAIDPGFERRISLRLEIALPSTELREQIWRSFFSDKTPLADDVDFRLLAKRFAFSGGYIKNAVQKAMRRCLSEGFDVITHKILEEAAEAEQRSRWTNPNEKPIGFARVG